MNRRSMLAMLGGSVAGLAAEEFLWRPTKAFSFPTPKPRPRLTLHPMTFGMLAEFDMPSGLYLSRIDVLYGWANMSIPDCALRLPSE